LLGMNGSSGESGWWLLSLFHPSESDSVEWRKGNYAITTRGGRIESADRWGEAKRPSRMVTEGSVIVADEEPRGSATDVAPEGFPHPVYRAGYALGIRVPFSSRAEARLQAESLPHIEPAPVEAPVVQEPVADIDTAPQPEEAGE
jgi:CRISPR/Cas system CSM-associated protein Csm4 (group 5 of RAMP superfamily)